MLSNLPYDAVRFTLDFLEPTEILFDITKLLGNIWLEVYAYQCYVYTVNIDNSIIIPKILNKLVLDLDFNFDTELIEKKKTVPVGDLSLFYKLSKEHLSHFELVFDDIFNKQILIDLKNVTHITFGWHYNKQLFGDFKNITHLTFGDSYNQPLPSDIKNVTHLTFGNSFNKVLPSNLKNVTHLTLGYWYNKPLPDNLKNVTHLTVGHKYNYPLPDNLKNITHLTLGHTYNHPIPSHIKYITQIKLENNYNQIYPICKKRCVIEDESFAVA